MPTAEEDRAGCLPRPPTPLSRLNSQAVKKAPSLAGAEAYARAALTALYAGLLTVPERRPAKNRPNG